MRILVRYPPLLYNTRYTSLLADFAWFSSRTPWEQDHGSMKEVLKSGWVNEEGYFNVGEELGLPEERGRTTIPLYRTRRTPRSTLAKKVFP